MEQNDWIKIIDIHEQTMRVMFSSVLHEGEIETMLLAKEMNCDLVILDDLLARKFANRLDLTLTRTLGSIIKAKEKGYINSVKSLLDDMMKFDFYPKFPMKISIYEI